MPGFRLMNRVKNMENENPSSIELPTGGQLDDVVALAREERKQQGDRATA